MTGPMCMWLRRRSHSGKLRTIWQISFLLSWLCRLSSSESQKTGQSTESSKQNRNTLAPAKTFSKSYLQVLCLMSTIRTKMKMTMMTRIGPMKSRMKAPAGRLKAFKACQWLRTWSHSASGTIKSSASWWNRLQAPAKSTSWASNSFMRLSKCSSFQTRTYC